MHPQAAEGDRKLETYLEGILRQLGVATEGTDSGVAEQASEATAGDIQCQAEVKHSGGENQPLEMERSCDLVAIETEDNVAGGTNKVRPGEPIFVSCTLVSITSSGSQFNLSGFPDKQHFRMMVSCSLRDPSTTTLPRRS